MDWHGLANSNGEGIVWTGIDWQTVMVRAVYGLANSNGEGIVWTGIDWQTVMVRAVYGLAWTGKQ